MPGPMSIPNGNTRTVTIVEHVDGERFERKVPITQLTGAQRARLAQQGKLDTGKTRRNRERR